MRLNNKEVTPKHKFNNGSGATLCNNCNAIINTGLTEDLYCMECEALVQTGLVDND
jgi:hypothetical protein